MRPVILIFLFLGINAVEPLAKSTPPPPVRTKKAMYKKSPISKQGFRAWEEEEADVVVVKEKTHSFNIVLPPRSQECFFLEVETGLMANIEYSVRSVNENDGSYTHLTAALYGDNPNEPVDIFESARSGFFQYQASSDHSIKLCFLHSGTNQRMVVLLDVITLKSTVETRKNVNFGENSLEKIETNLLRSFHQVYLIKNRLSLDIEHLKGVASMVDYRSCLYIILAAAVGLAQIAIHKHLFSKKPRV